MTSDLDKRDNINEDREKQAHSFSSSTAAAIETAAQNENRNIAEFSRRKFLQLSTAGALTPAALLHAGSAHAESPSRSLGFYNLHTEEKLRTEYWENNSYHIDSLADINHVLRDFRANTSIAMDTSLLDMLYVLKQMVGSKQDYHVISGYRSPHTNAKLAAAGRGVAKRSFHMQGRAIDVRLPDVKLETLYEAAVNLQAGGAGIYHRSNFLHIDTGPIRNWG